MATIVKLKNSVTTTAAPTTLVQGEVAVNVTDKKVWVGNAASGVVQLVGPGSTDVAVADGGTGASSITANSVILGNGTSALSGNLVAPGTSGNVLTSNGTTWTSAAVSAGGTITSGTSVASTSGTSIDFTSIPSGVKRITVMFDGVSTNGTSNIQIQVGTSGGVVATGYTSGIGYRNGEATSTTGFVVGQMVNSTVSFSGVATINSFGSNIWTSGGTMSRNDGWAVLSGGFVSNIGGTLDRIRITTINGTDAFDAGSINILYE